MKFSLDWFKSFLPKKEEPKVEEKQQEKELELNDFFDGVKKAEKPYKTLFYVNEFLTVLLHDGNVLGRKATLEEYEKVKSAKNEQELFKLMTSHEEVVPKNNLEKKLFEETKEIIDNFSILEKSGQFEVRDNAVYFKGINRSLPKLLVKKFIELCEIDDYEQLHNPGSIELNQEFIALKRFWGWCVLNPNLKVADWLYEFLMEGDFKITKDGMFLGYRRVCSINEDKSGFVDFVSNCYVKVKTTWKKKPSDFEVFGNEEKGFYIGTVGNFDEHVGNLQQLYLDLPDFKENRYTDNYSHTMDIRIGQPVVLPRSECNYSTEDCGVGGLHFSNKKFNYYSFGDTGILMLVNPYNVVGIGPHKGRCCEYLPLCTLSPDEERQILEDEDFDTTELQEYYALEQLEELEERVKSDYMTEIGKKEFNLPSLSTEEVKSIISDLNLIRNEVSKRTVSI